MNRFLVAVVAFLLPLSASAQTTVEWMVLARQQHDGCSTVGMAGGGLAMLVGVAALALARRR